MTRLFTFGCSFTKYIWPTWADILLQVYPGQNWALPGGGNKFIFESLVECIVTNNITKDDIVIIMWSSWAREDRFSSGGWKLVGNVYNNHLYDKDFLTKHWSDEGAILDSLNWISASHKMLSLIGCKYFQTSAFPLFQVKEYTEICNLEDFVDVKKYEKYFKFLNNYKDATVLENLYQDRYHVTGTEWRKTSWSDTPTKDNHPFPLDHYNWLNDHIIPKLNLSQEELNNMEQYVTNNQNYLIELSKTDDHPGIKHILKDMVLRIS